MTDASQSMPEQNLGEKAEELYNLLDAMDVDQPGEFLARRHLLDAAKNIAHELYRGLLPADSDRGETSFHHRALGSLIHGTAGQIPIEDITGEASRRDDATGSQ